MNQVLDFLASQISSLTNPTNIANALTSLKNEKVNPALIANYVQYTMDSFLIHMARRYDVKGKTYFKYPNKYYYTDMGLRNARLNYRQYDPGHIMENITGADKKLYIQAAFRMDTAQKESSELASLLLVKDFFRKIVIRMDIPHHYYDDVGIFHCNLLDFLLERVEPL